jgi:uncharacterized glyoxalase superfamily protein PhnB
MTAVSPISPYLYYDDGIAALEYLVKVFGFEERMRQVDSDGALRHGEAQFGSSVVMLASVPESSPNRLGRPTAGMYVRVDDVDAHYERTLAAGATAESAPEDQPYGARIYGVKDPSGHTWWFAQDISPSG